MALRALVPTLMVPDFTLRLARDSPKDWSSGFRFVREASRDVTAYVFTT